MSTKIVVNGTTVDLGVKQEDVNAAVDVKMGDLNAILDAINNGSSPANLRDVTVAIEPSDAGSVHGAGYATDGVVMSLSADLNEGYKIDHWEKNGQVITASDRYDMTVDGNAAVTAVATTKKYVLGRDWRLVPLGDGTKVYACRRLAYGRSLYIMTVFNTDICLVSNDGITWNEQTLPISGKWFSIVFTGTKFIMQNDEPGGKWLDSTNGTTWTQRSFPNSKTSLFCVSYAENETAYFLPTSANTNAYATKDAITWREISLPLSSGNWNQTVKLGNRRIAIKANHSNDKQYLYTDDGGETWGVGEFPDYILYPRIAVFQEKIIAMSEREPVMFTSSDGINWEKTTTQEVYQPTAGVSANGTLTFKQYGGTVSSLIETTDLVNWTLHTIANSAENVAYNVQYTTYSFSDIAMFIANSRAIIVSYSTDDEPPVIPELAASANTLSLDDEEVIE